MLKFQQLSLPPHHPCFFPLDQDPLQPLLKAICSILGSAVEHKEKGHWSRVEPEGPRRLCISLRPARWQQQKSERGPLKGGEMESHTGPFPCLEVRSLSSRQVACGQPQASMATQKPPNGAISQSTPLFPRCSPGMFQQQKPTQRECP